MTTGGLIFKAIPAILADIGAIGKDKECTQGARFKFRGIDDVYNALHPVLANHKVFPTAKILDKQYSERESKSGGCLTFTKLTIEYTLHAEDGSSVTTEAVGEAMDSGDKSCNKAMSIAYKYALFQLLCIPTEAIDPDSEVHEPVPAKQRADAIAKQHGMKTADQLAELTDAERAYIREASSEITKEVSREDKAVAEANLEAIAAFIKDKSEPVRKALGPLWMTSMKLVNPAWKKKAEATAA